MNKICKILGLAGIVLASEIGVEPKTLVKPQKVEWTITEQDGLLPNGNRINRVTKLEITGSSTYILSSAIYDSAGNLIIMMSDTSDIKPKYERFYTTGVMGLVM